MRYAFFPGCIAKNVYPSIERSTRMVLAEVGVELLEYPYSCCPAPSVIASYDMGSWLTLGARNLSLSESDGLDLLIICNGCYGTLHRVYETLKGDGDKKKIVNEHLRKIGMEYEGDVKPIHFIDALDELRGKIIEKKKIDLDLKVAIHYGCHFLKPSEHSRHNSENPKVVDEIVELLGCKSIKFKDKLSCCGAGGGLWSGGEDIALLILKDKLINVENAGADCIINICPFCHMHLDQGQSKLSGFSIPILHLNQLIGLSFGIPEKRLGLHTHLISTMKVTEDVNKKIRELEMGDREPRRRRRR
ncbi:MAG: heterodisulfide reductase-related iron-sulfur binding cluster [Halobacteriota archaeon]|nr:heterodisulfide reductase-related iron-sulfur binding cluster [Halobacteriota archaeon]